MRPKIMSRQNQPSFLRTLAASITALGSAAVLLLPVSTIATHGRVTTPARFEKSKNAANRPPFAKLQASDSPEGSRVLLTGVRSRKEYETYRRGDRFYLKLPPMDVRHAEDLRGRAFREVRVERDGKATIVIFRLRSGATARVELKGNKLEIMFTVSRPGAAVSTVAPAAVRRDNRKSPAQADSKRGKAVVVRPKAATIAASKVTNSGKRAATRASKDHLPTKVASQAGRRADVLAQSASPALVEPTQTSPVGAKSRVAEQQRTSPSAARTSSVSRTQTSTWNNLKQHARSWLLVAQLNPAPVGIGATLLMILLGLMLLRRRRAEEPNHARALTGSALREDVLHNSSASETNNFAPPAAPAGSQMIDKLVLDNAHRADVMDSRSPEDRQVIEASLINLITDAHTMPEDRKRARLTLEEYGFVAQQCANLLTGRSAWERASAARSLAQIGSQSSLPFLIEALHDDDSLVRNEAVAGLASLKDPAAIGALLQAARTHPDVPASLLSDSLSACSVESLGPLELPAAEVSLPDLSTRAESDDADLFQELAAIGGDDDDVSEWLNQLDGADEKPDAVRDTALPFREAQERPYLTLVA